MPTYGPARASRIELRCSADQRAAYSDTAGGAGRLTEWILATLDREVTAARRRAIQPVSAASEKSTRPAKKSRRGG